MRVVLGLQEIDVKYLLLLLLVSCSGTMFGSSKPQEIRCWSGGTVMFEGKSIGAVIISRSGHFVFIDHETGRLTEISGDCIMRDVVEK